MNELLRCPHCHHWSDALLVWAFGDCCPNCNGEMKSRSHEPERRIAGSHVERAGERVRPPLRRSGLKPRRAAMRPRISGTG